jgi:hypothetical protein
MLCLLYTLIQISIVVKDYNDEFKSTYLYNITSFSFNIYFGWITVAIVANFTGLLVSYEWSGLGISHDIWTSLIIIVAIIIASFTFFKNRALWYLLPIIWAFYGIYIKHTVILEGEYLYVVNSLLLGMGILSFLVFKNLYNIIFKKY